MCTRCWCWPLHLGLLPLFTGAIMAGGIMTTYTIAVSLGHVSPILPSISDTGIMSPEMQIFSQVMNIVAALAFMTFVVRFKIINSWVNEEERRLLRTLTTFNLCIGCIASIGLSIVGNFQDNTSIIVHLVGAFIVFLLGNGYMVLDAVVTRKMYPKYTHILLFWIRLFLGLTGTIAFIFTVVGAMIANKSSIFSVKKQRLHWGPNDEGYTSHLVSTFGEWTMGFAFICYFFTYVIDFKKFESRLAFNIKVEYVEELSLCDSGGKPGYISESLEVNQGASHQPTEQTTLLGKIDV